MSNIDSKHVSIKEIPIEQEGKRIGTIAILIGGIGHTNPKAFMDDQVYQYTKGCSHNQFVESHLDMPWVRIVIDCINEIEYDVFTKQRLKKKDGNK